MSRTSASASVVKATVLMAPNDEDLVPRLVRAWLLRAPDVAQHCIFLIRAHCLLSLAHVELPRTRACPVRSRREGREREREKEFMSTAARERERQKDLMYTAAREREIGTKGVHVYSRA